MGAPTKSSSEAISLDDAVCSRGGARSAREGLTGPIPSFLFAGQVVWNTIRREAQMARTMETISGIYCQRGGGMTCDHTLPIPCSCGGGGGSVQPCRSKGAA